MSYKTATVTGLLDGETGYQLDTGDYIAVSQRGARDCQPNHIGVTIKARWVDAQGAPQMDHANAPVEWEFTESALQSGFTAATGAVTATSLIQLALDKCIQGGADGATPDQTHPDGGIKARIAAVKAIKSILT